MTVSYCKRFQLHYKIIRITFLNEKRSYWDINSGQPWISISNKLKTNVEHRTDNANALFEGELYAVSLCFPVDCSDQLYQRKKSSILQRLPLCKANLKDWIGCRSITIVSDAFSQIFVANFHNFGINYYMTTLKRLEVHLIELTLFLINTFLQSHSRQSWYYHFRRVNWMWLSWELQ